MLQVNVGKWWSVQLIVYWGSSSLIKSSEREPPSLMCGSVGAIPDLPGGELLLTGDWLWVGGERQVICGGRW